MDQAKLPAAGQTLKLSLEGGAGPIEALLAAPQQPRRRPGFAVICHPHPLMGGAMSNKVTYMLASSTLQAGLHALRFNFRGVGGSAGSHDQGRGEREDLLRLFEWMRAHWPAPQAVLAGFSFGGFVALSAAPRARPDALVTVAPPLGHFAEGELPAPPCPWLLIHSRDDEVVPFDDTRRLSALAQPPQLLAAEGCGHFFHGRLDVIKDAVVPFLDAHLAA